MKEFKGFQKELIEKLEQKMSADVKEGLTIEPIEMCKTNDVKLNGLKFNGLINDEEKVICPVCYIDEMYSRYAMGENIDDLANEIVDILSRCVDVPADMDVANENIKFEDIRDNLYVRLLEKERNKGYLKDAVTKDVGGGLVYAVDLFISTPLGDEGRAVVTDSLVKTWGVSREEVIETAIRNTEKDKTPQLSAMSDALRGSRINLLNLPKGEHVSIDMGVLSYAPPENETASAYGAAALFFQGILEKIRNLLDSDYYILPSSVHEFLLLPMTEDQEPERLHEIVLSANRDVNLVNPEDVLSDKVFAYKNGRFAVEIG